MIIQLSNGRIIELSLEQYLDLTDSELQELNCLGLGYTKDCSNPFYNPYHGKEEVEEEYEDETLYFDDDDEIEGNYFIPNDEIF